MGKFSNVKQQKNTDAYYVYQSFDSLQMSHYVHCTVRGFEAGLFLHVDQTYLDYIFRDAYSCDTLH